MENQCSCQLDTSVFITNFVFPSIFCMVMKHNLTALIYYYNHLLHPFILNSNGHSTFSIWEFYHSMLFYANVCHFSHRCPAVTEVDHRNIFKKIGQNFRFTNLLKDKVSNNFNIHNYLYITNVCIVYKLKSFDSIETFKLLKQQKFSQKSTMYHLFISTHINYNKFSQQMCVCTCLYT